MSGTGKLLPSIEQQDRETERSLTFHGGTEIYYRVLFICCAETAGENRLINTGTAQEFRMQDDGEQPWRRRQAHRTHPST